MKKLLAMIFTVLFVLLCGCAQTEASASTVSPSNDPDFSVFGEDILEEDLEIPEIALQWQARNAPIFLQDDFFDDYTQIIDDNSHIDFNRAMNSIEIDVSFNCDEQTITITPQHELGPLMFQFTLYCLPVEEMQLYVCCEYLYEFMHTNSNTEEWLCFFSESEPPNDDTQFYVIDVDGEEFWLTDNVFFEVDSTIGTMMMLGTDDGFIYDDLEDLEMPSFAAATSL